MVRLEEVEDETFLHNRDPDNDDDYTDTDSSISGDEANDDLTFNESISDRIYALKDMISPTARRRLGDIYDTVSSYTKSGFWISAKGAYAFSFAALFFGVPFALLSTDDLMLAEQEKEMKMREMGNEMLTASDSQSGQGQGKAQAAL